MHPLAQAVLDGESKAAVMPNQAAVVDLFKAGLSGRSGTGNLETEDGMLWHYQVLEAVRTRQGRVIRNSQCWSAGFAVCPLVRADLSLPLSTLGDEITSHISQLQGIEILDIQTGAGNDWGNDWWDTALFLCRDRLFLFGFDEVPYLAEIETDPKGWHYGDMMIKTVKEAIEALKPLSVRFAWGDGGVKRQGDLFFIPAREERPFASEIEQTGIKAHFELMPPWNGAPEAFSKEKRLIRPAILKTNHTARELVTTPRGTFVRGDIRHGSIRTFNRQHSIIQLGTEWYFAVQNLAVNSWNIERGRGGGGFD